MDIFEIISQKTWTQLSVQELGQLMDMGIDEQQFFVLKNNWSDYSNQPMLEPSDELKSNLDQAFAEKYGDSDKGIAGTWKWIAAAAIGLLLIGFGFMKWHSPDTAVQMAKVEVQEEQVAEPEEEFVDVDSEVEVISDDKIPSVKQIVSDEPQHLGMFNGPEVHGIEYEKRVDQPSLTTKAEEVNEIMLSANSKIATEESRADGMVVAAELPRASSSNSTTNSVVAYRKMMEDKESAPEADKIEIKVVKLSDLNIKSNGLINLY